MLSLRNLLLFGCRDAAALAETQKRDNHLQKNIVKIFRVLLYANALFCL